MFDIKDSPGARLEGNRTTGDTIAKVSKSPDFAAINNEAGGTSTVPSGKGSFWQRVRGWFLATSGKAISTGLAAAATALAKWIFDGK